MSLLNFRRWTAVAVAAATLAVPAMAKQPVGSGPAIPPAPGVIEGPTLLPGYGAPQAPAYAEPYGGPGSVGNSGIPLQPVPAGDYDPTASQLYVPTGVVPLYDNVKYRAERNIAPCAVEKFVCVQDPCDPCAQVVVKICVPPCAAFERVKVTRNGRKVKYDYGKYAVEITSLHRGAIVVHYHD